LPVIQPEVDRREVSEADIDTENFEIGAYLGYMSVEDFGTNFVYGARLAYHLSEKFFVEGTYGTTDTDETSFEKLSGGAPLLSDDDRELTYYDISVGYNLLPGEVFVGSDLAMNSALYVLAGVGNTDFADDNYFTVVLGAGYRVLPTDSIAVHFAVRDHMFDSDLLGDSKVTHNIEFNLGLTYFF
jgi:outer membrane beta-barrel protein